MKNKVPSFVSRVTALALFASPLCCIPAQAQEVYSQVVGAIALDVPQQSDVVVAFPFKQSASFRGKIVSASGSVAALESSALTAGDFNAPASGATHYLYVESGDLMGRRFDVVSNTANSLTVDAADLTGIANATVSVREHWTLGEAFPQGVGFVEETEPGLRDVELILPEAVSVGGGLAASRVFYYFDQAWREVGKPLSTAVDATTLPPGAAFVIRNNSFSSLRSYFFGEVVDAPLAIPLVSAAGEEVDNFVSLERPLGLTLNDLGLHNSGVFTASTGTTAETRGDSLLVYPAGEGKNKTPIEYYYYNGAWLQAGGDAADKGTTEIKAGQGVAIRKAAGATGTDYWVNEWSLAQ